MTLSVFLGGTCNESTWRDELIPMLNQGISAFNPVVPDWNEEAYRRELHARAYSDYVLYVITPRMTGVYSIAEVVDDSNKRPKKTIFTYLERDNDLSFNAGQLKSLKAVGSMVKENGGKVFVNLQEIADFLNLALVVKK